MKNSTVIPDGVGEAHRRSGTQHKKRGRKATHCCLAIGLTSFGVLRTLFVLGSGSALREELSLAGMTRTVEFKLLHYRLLAAVDNGPAIG